MCGRQKAQRILFDFCTKGKQYFSLSFKIITPMKDSSCHTLDQGNTIARCWKPLPFLASVGSFFFFFFFEAFTAQIRQVLSENLSRSFPLHNWMVSLNQCKMELHCDSLPSPTMAIWFSVSLPLPCPFRVILLQSQEKKSQVTDFPGLHLVSKSQNRCDVRRPLTESSQWFEGE